MCGIIFLTLVTLRLTIILHGTFLSIRSHRHLSLLTGIPRKLRQAGDFNTRLSYVRIADDVCEFMLTLSYLLFQVPGKLLIIVQSTTGLNELFSGVIAFTLLVIPFQVLSIIVKAASLSLEKSQGFFLSTRKALKKELKETALIETAIIAVLALVGSLILSQKGWFYWTLPLAILGVSVVLTLQQRVFTSKKTGRYPPLPKGRLRNKLDQLATHSGFPVVEIRVSNNEDTEGTHSQAEFSGPFSQKTIILSPTLLKKRDQEIVSLVAHELGHAYHHHEPMKGIILVVLTALALVGAYYIQTHRPFTAMWGLPATPAATLISLTMWATVIYWWLKIPLNALGRFQEYQADAYAITLLRKLPRYMQVHPARAFEALSVDEFRLDEPAFTEFFLRDEPNIHKRLARMEGKSTH